ncbi:MAG: DMT family transporter [Parvularcula sp.]
MRPPIVTWPNSGSSPQRVQLYLALSTLIGAGLLLGITTNLAKVAHRIDISPFAYLIWSLAGSTLILMIVSTLRGETTRVTRHSLEYFIVAGFLTTAGSNLIFFSAVPHLGVSFISIMLSLPPLFTYVGALILGMERFCYWRASGVIFALAGTALLVVRQWTSSAADPKWIAVALIGPILLSMGNIYRTRRWPSGASAESLASGIMIGATGLLVMFALVLGRPLRIPTNISSAIPLVAFQALVFAGQFYLLLVLQKVGGPVFLSLMGSVGAAFGVPISIVLLAEPTVPALFPSAALIAAGVIAMVLGSRRPPQRSALMEAP